LLAEERWDEALTVAEDQAARGDRTDNPAWMPWGTLQARALDALGLHDRARALLVNELDVARRWGSPGAIGATLRVLGSRSPSDGIDLLHEAVAVTESSSARLEHAKTLVALGTALRHGGRRTEARDPLVRGHELAQQCHAVALAATAKTELYAAGGRPRREALSGPDSLTPSERRIADLAAEGHTTRDIAQTLFVTTRTVEGHLTNVYRKLGISTRAALPEALGGDSSRG
jgi:DNA-binding CsgD family transcriptional regulator